MKGLIKAFLCILVCLCVQGCSEDKNYLNPKEFYSLKDTLKGEILSTPIESKSNIVGMYYTEYGLIACTGIDNKLFQLLDTTNASKIAVTGKRGRGPNEFLVVMGMQYDYSNNQFSVYDLYKQSVTVYSISRDSIIFEKMVNLKRDLLKVKYLNDTLLAFVNFYPNQKIGLINTKAEIIYEEDYNSLDDDNVKTINAYHSVNMAISPNKEYCVIIGLSIPLLKVFSIQNNQFQLKWKKMFFKPKYDYVKDWYVLKDDQYFGFRSLYLTNKYIYLSCDDTRVIDFRKKMPYPKHTYVLVMDYEGNIVNKYLMDKFFYTFTVSPNGKSLYAMIDDPDLLIAKYSLP